MQTATRVAAQRIFDEAYRGQGGRLRIDHPLSHTVNELAAAIAVQNQGGDSILANGPLWDRLYADIVASDALNGFVCEVDGIFVIGVTTGVVDEIFDRLSAVVAMHSLTDPEHEYVKTFLSSAALLFVLGHECGHITEGHLRRFQDANDGHFFAETLSPALFAARSNSYLEEAEADTIGAMSTASVITTTAFREDFLRLVSATDIATATGLVLFSLGTVIATFAGTGAAANLVNDSNYPHPIVRLIVASRALMDVVAFTAPKVLGVDFTIRDSEKAFNLGLLALCGSDDGARKLLDDETTLIRERFHELHHQTASCRTRWIDCFVEYLLMTEHLRSAKQGR